jgi:hypothetical protein
MSTLQGTVEKIGPIEAEKYLKNNSFNRPFKPRHMLFLSRQMTQKLWRKTAEPIIFDKDDQLQDGQHRLKAIMNSGTTQDFFVIRGAEPEAFDVMDTGKKRSYHDALYIAGFTDPVVYGSLAGKLMRWHRSIFFGSNNAAMIPTNAEVVEFCKEHKRELAKTVNFYNGVRAKNKGLIGGGTFMMCYHLCAHSNEAQAEDFFTKLLTGLNTEHNKYQPLDMLRFRLITNKRDEAKLPSRLVVLMVLSAWNYFRKTKRMNGLPGPIDLKVAKGKKFEIF